MGLEVLGTLTIAGVLSAVSVFIVLMTLGIRKAAGYHIWIDVIFSVAFVFVFAGTFSGMITAFTGGLTLTVLLLIVRWTMGYARYYRKWGWRYFAPGETHA